MRGRVAAAAGVGFGFGSAMAFLGFLAAAAGHGCYVTIRLASAPLGFLAAVSRNAFIASSGRRFSGRARRRLGGGSGRLGRGYPQPGRLGALTVFPAWAASSPTGLFANGRHQRRHPRVRRRAGGGLEAPAAAPRDAAAGLTSLGKSKPGTDTETALGDRAAARFGLRLRLGLRFGQGRLAAVAPQAEGPRAALEAPGPADELAVAVAVVVHRVGGIALGPADRSAHRLAALGQYGGVDARGLRRYT